MSEKRLASSGDSFVDLTEMQIVDLLNKLSDENTRLHKKVDEQQEQLDLYKEAILTMLGLLADKGIIFSGVKDE